MKEGGWAKPSGEEAGAGDECTVREASKLIAFKASFRSSDVAVSVSEGQLLGVALDARMKSSGKPRLPPAWQQPEATTFGL